MRYGMLIDLDRCVGCQACVSSCKERWDTGPGAHRDWVHTYESGKRGQDLKLTFFPGLCMHCDEHPCTKECPTGATFATAEGVVVVDRDLCIGCGSCVAACPYGARTIDESQGIVEKCNLCLPYVKRGEQPACVKTCLAECRIFGDLQDPKSTIVRRIGELKAAPLFSEEVNIGAKTFYGPPAKRAEVLQAMNLRPAAQSNLSRAWDYTRPVATWGVPALAGFVGSVGLLLNLRNRGRHHGGEIPPVVPPKLKRHTLGMRVLHWFNAASWVVLLVTGTALLATPHYALFGTAFPAAVARLLGGADRLIGLHVAWGLLWAAVIVPAFLAMKRGGLDAIKEVRLTGDDLRWLVLKPLALFGRAQLPPQDKYNAGQKVFALSALVGTSLIIATGFIMAGHWGGATVVAAAVFVHKLAIGLALVGLAVHITMAAILREERAALRSMVKGEIDGDHAWQHNRKWVEEKLRREPKQDD